MKCWKVAVTFEKGAVPPKTVRLAIPAASLRTAATRALKAATHYYPHSAYDSVVLLIERDDSLLPRVDTAERIEALSNTALVVVPAAFFRPKHRSFTSPGLSA